jgi:hypothetical protein
MGSGGSKLKGEKVSDLTSSPPPPPKQGTHSRKSASRNPDQPAHTSDDDKTYTSTFTNTYSQDHNAPQPSAEQQPQKPFENTFTHDPPPQDNEAGEKSRRQSLKDRWKTRHGVPEPRDENGRGVYTGKTKEEQARHARSLPIEPWAVVGVGGGAM